MRVAVFGGAFDPPHLGHLALARQALATFNFDRLLVVLAGDPPHKPVTTPAEIRAGLTELAFAQVAHVEISRIELEPGGPRYTVDTLRALSANHDELTLLVGADQFASFLSWREPETILELANVAVASRPGVAEQDLEPVRAALAHPERVSFFPIPAYPIASEAIRARVREGLPISTLVSPTVATEIKRLGLYHG